MTLYSILLGIQYASIMLMLFMCAYISKKWSKSAHGWLFFYCTVALVNNAGYLALMHAQTEREAILIWQFTYLCRAWIPFSLFMFVLLLCTGKRYSRVMNVLSLFHVATYLCVLTMRHNSLYYKAYKFVEDGLFPHLVLTNGIWHRMYDTLCFVYVVIGVRLLILSIVKEKNHRKKMKFLFITIAILVDCMSFILSVFRFVPGYDMNSLGYTIAAVFFYIAIFGFDFLDTKNLTEAVFVQDSGNVFDNAETSESKSKIEAVGDLDSRVKLPLKEILYFEADAEQVFAYSMQDIYKVNMRLYQIEEIAQQSGIIRVSKSHLINVKKIQSVRPALNSRLYAKMLNGEEVLVSRKYAHSLKNLIA